jgi:hypothetical protein
MTRDTGAAMNEEDILGVDGVKLHVRSWKPTAVPGQYSESRCWWTCA